MFCATVIDAANAQIERQRTDSLRRSGHMQEYALTGHLRLQSPCRQIGRRLVLRAECPMDVAQRRSGLPQPDGIKCAKVEMSKPAT